MQQGESTRAAGLTFGGTTPATRVLTTVPDRPLICLALIPAFASPPPALLQSAALCGRRGRRERTRRRTKMRTRKKILVFSSEIHQRLISPLILDYPVYTRKGKMRRHMKQNGDEDKE